jgi:hypothetical protein
VNKYDVGTKYNAYSSPPACLTVETKILNTDFTRDRARKTDQNTLQIFPSI